MRSLLRWRVVISLTVTVFSSSFSLSRILKATVLSLSTGWADWWAGVGSMDWKLRPVST